MGKKVSAEQSDGQSLLGLVYTRDKITIPPFSREGAQEAAFLVRQLRLGVSFSEPQWKPMLSIGRGCGELRFRDGKSRLSFRIIYYRDQENVLVLAIFPKKTEKTPLEIINACKQRLGVYLQAKKTVGKKSVKKK